ncbi:hypothetical protein [Mesorhizobium sp. LNHC209A00]|uniref:hypothetical protein n=1 Tax=Mesorhizobium TaxID=68287 RepID=UPI0003CFD103|nr:hypothetical protein [Mesorhizobium sp. LNHC209A00]ESY91589.1 hypothetical protein X738_28400 [Mesorhizobium sp. LNHC209A00]
MHGAALRLRIDQRKRLAGFTSGPRDLPARHANLAGAGFHLATVSAAGAIEPLLAVISFTTSRAGHAHRTPVTMPLE